MPIFSAMRHFLELNISLSLVAILGHQMIVLAQYGITETTPLATNQLTSSSHINDMSHPIMDDVSLLVINQLSYNNMTPHNSYCIK